MTHRHFEETVEARRKLEALFEKHPNLFEPINLEDYSSGPGLSGLDEERLTEGGEANWIAFDLDMATDKLQTYRFRWSDVEEFGILRPADLS